MQPTQNSQHIQRVRQARVWFTAVLCATQCVATGKALQSLHRKATMAEEYVSIRKCIHDQFYVVLAQQPRSPVEFKVPGPPGRGIIPSSIALVRPVMVETYHLPFPLGNYHTLISASSSPHPLSPSPQPCPSATAVTAQYHSA